VAKAGHFRSLVQRGKSAAGFESGDNRVYQDSGQPLPYLMDIPITEYGGMEIVAE
jgi:hypothetical protein